MASKKQTTHYPAFAAHYLQTASIFLIMVLLFVSAALLVQNSKSIPIFVAEPPVVASIDGHHFLSYELYVSDYSPFQPSKLEVIDNNNHIIYTLAGDALNKTLLWPKHINQTVVRLWIDLEGNQIPANLTHRLYFADSFIVSKGAFTRVISKPLPVLSPPLRPARWLAMNGPSNFNAHRNAIFELNGNRFVPQRYAIDWVIMDEEGSWRANINDSNSDYYAYGQELLAVADGTIILVQDGVPDNVPGEVPPIVINRLGGNFVVIDLHNGYYAFYGHMIPGSVRVKNGDNVTTGQVLGSLGNSGNSNPAHLHFHLCDTPDYLFCHGQPYVFSTYSSAQIFTSNPPDLVPSPVYSAFTNSMPGDLDSVRWE